MFWQPVIGRWLRKSRSRVVVFIFFFLVSWPELFAQSSANEDVVIKAMRDELERSMAELKSPKLEKPFFIMYNVVDLMTYSVVAELGSIVRSAEDHYRYKTNMRVLVGDYAFNDESVDDIGFKSWSPLEIDFPLEDDYLGMRRSLWSSTDYTYRTAAHKFEKHKATWQESGKTLEEFPHHALAKGKPVTVVSMRELIGMDRPAWEARLRRLSALFLQCQTINNSGVNLYFSEGHTYMVNSEGTVSKIPFSRVNFVAYGQIKGAEGIPVSDQVSYFATSPDQLPTEAELHSEIKKMIAKLEDQAKAPSLSEEYEGPVLLTGPAVAELFSSLLFESRESLRANHDLPDKVNYPSFFNNGGGSKAAMEAKLGKPVMNESITVKVKPKLKAYGGVTLLGSFEIDDEGIVPPDELVLVDKGVLKNLINDRTITKPSHTNNGFSSGPGVIEVTIAQKNSEKVLKEKLIEQAKKDGLDYALIIREASYSLLGSICAYKVSVVDGSEELMPNVTIQQLPLKALKRILGASEKYEVYNVMSKGGYGTYSPYAMYEINPMTYRYNQRMMSVIAPAAVLIEELQVQPFKIPVAKDEDYVPSPLK